MSDSLHRFTPSLAAYDPRGLVVRDVGYHRSTAQDEPQARIERWVYASSGLMVEQWDARLFQLQRSEPATLANQRTVYSLGGEALRTDSVDAGWHLMLPGAAGQVLHVWDGRGAHQVHHYDPYQRAVAVFEQAAADAQLLCVERLGYAAYSVEEAALNRCGRVIRHDDDGGSVCHERYGVHGEVALQTRRFRQQSAAREWPQLERQRDAQLEPERFATTVGFNALGERLHHIDAKGNRVEHDYGVDGQPAGVFVSLKGGIRQRLMDQRRYDAAGQVLSERAGNGVVRSLRHDPLDGRLRQMTAHLPGTAGQRLQDLRYAYDRVGNIVRIDDLEQSTQWSRNTRVGAASLYEYDTLSRLTKASGRETVGKGGGPSLPDRVAFGSTDDSVWRRYTQHFSYDEAGNLLQLRHVPSRGAGYTRRMTVGARSNHFLPGGDGEAAPGLGQGYDRCGNLQTLEGINGLEWNVRNQLVRMTQVARQGEDDDEVHYAYDAAGQRILKRQVYRARARVHTAQVRYLPGLEIRHDSATGEQLNVLNLNVGTTTVHVLQWDNPPSGMDQDTQIRFGLSDHLGSSTLETDEQGQRIRHESYFPYGGTAWWAARNASEASYTFIRYSGKERDAGGLYYYGFRYYAPWLCRWISPDPAGDGLNSYAMVGNNPVTFIDSDGLQRQRAALTPANELIKATAALIILGAVGGALLGYEIIGGSIGALIGGVLSAYIYRHERRSRPRPRPTQMTENQFGEVLTNRAIEMAGYYGLSNEEASRLMSFAYEQRHGMEVSFLVSVTENSLYAHAGPTAATSQAKTLTFSNPTRNLARIGWATQQLRGPARSQRVENVHASSVPQFEVAATGRATGTRRERQLAAAEQRRPIQQNLTPTPSSFVIDTTAVDGIDPMSREGRSIALALSHLREGRFGAVHWHQHQDRLWSVDLHGYSGSRNRGAYRMMLQHIGGRHYQVQGVRNPHGR